MTHQSKNLKLGGYCKMAYHPQVKPRVKINSAQYFRPKPPSLRIGSEISGGAYGLVHSGELGGRPVAVKMIHRLLLEAARNQGDFDQVVARFKRECQLLERIDHPHVVYFRGAFYDETTDGPVLVMEKMQENLLQFLKRSGNELSPQKQLEICLAIVRGLHFLHTHTPPIVHLDLTDKNVLLGKDGLVKIGDLGQSRLKANNADYFTSAQPGAIPFMPPEAMQKHSRYNEKLDVFSLGVLMLEIATQQPPCVDMFGIGVREEVDRRKEDLAKLKEGHRLKPLILSCLKNNPQERPDIVSIHDQLLAMVEGVEIKPDSLREQITSLQLALQEARHEAKLTSQFQADIAQCDTTIQQLVVKCEQMEAQATTYKLDFEQERRDRQEAARKFEEERQTWQRNILALNEKQEELQLEHDEIYAQFEQLKEASVSQKRQHEEEIDELKAKVKAAEDKEKHSRNSSQIMIIAQEGEIKRLIEKLQNVSQEIANLQEELSVKTTTSSTLQSLNERLLEELAAERKAKQELEDKYVEVQEQATSYQLDFERERRDKEEAMVKFAKETKIWKGDVANLSERLNALGLEHSETLDQLDFLKKCSGLEGHKREVYKVAGPSDSPYAPEMIRKHSSMLRTMPAKSSDDRKRKSSWKVLRRTLPSALGKRAANKVHIAQKPDWESGPKVACASCIHRDKELVRVTEDTRRLSELVQDLERDNSELQDANKRLRDTVECSKEEIEELSSEIHLLKSNFLDSSRDRQKQQEVEERMRQLNAEMKAVIKEKEDLKHQVAEVHDERERAKHKVIVDAEKDKNLLLEEIEHYRTTVESLNDLLDGKEDSLRQLQEELRTVKATSIAMEDKPGMIQDSAWTAFEEDFKAERRDRESAHGKFADTEKKWMDQLEALGIERDKLAADILVLKDQLVAGKREHDATKKELEAAKGKMGQKAKATEEHFQNVFMKKDDEIHRLHAEIRGLKPIAENYRVLFAEHKELKLKFEAIWATNQTVQHVVHEMQGEKAAADSRLKELTLVVNQVTGENDTLNQQNAQLKQQIEGFERMFAGMNSKNQALEVENTRLKEAICLPDTQITPRSSLVPPPSQTEGHRSLPSPTSQRHGQQPHVRPPQPNQPEQHRNPSDYQTQVGTTYGYSSYGQQNPQYGKPCNEQELIIRQDPPGPYDANDETDSPPLSNEAERYSALPKQDPHSCRPAAQAPACSEPARAKHRDAFQPQFPHSDPSIMGSDARAWPDVENRPADIKYPPAASERYQAATQPPMDASKIRPQNSNGSTSETSLSLPLPLTNRKPGFEANRRYIGEDIHNWEIRHEARRYKEDKLAVEPANAAADVEEWPFDPNLTCNFCGTMFRRGQICEFRYHVDECTARSMEGTK